MKHNSNELNSKETDFSKASIRKIIRRFFSDNSITNISQGDFNILLTKFDYQELLKLMVIKYDDEKNVFNERTKQRLLEKIKFVNNETMASVIVNLHSSINSHHKFFQNTDNFGDIYNVSKENYVSEEDCNNVIEKFLSNTLSLLGPKRMFPKNDEDIRINSNNLRKISEGSSKSTENQMILAYEECFPDTSDSENEDDERKENNNNDDDEDMNAFRSEFPKASCLTINSEEKINKCFTLAFERTIIDLALVHYNQANIINESGINKFNAYQLESRPIKKIFMELNISTLIQLKKVFSLLDLSMKKKLNVYELGQIKKYKFIQLKLFDIFKYILTFSSNLSDFTSKDGKPLPFKELNETEISINQYLFGVVYNTIEEKLQEKDYYNKPEYLVEFEAKRIKEIQQSQVNYDDIIINNAKQNQSNLAINNNNIVGSKNTILNSASKDNNNNNNSNTNYPLFSNNSAFVQSLLSTNKDLVAYNLILHDILSTYDNFTQQSLNLSYEKIIEHYKSQVISLKSELGRSSLVQEENNGNIINSNQQRNESELSYEQLIRENINEIKDYLKLKQQDFEFFFKEIDKCNYYINNRLENLMIYLGRNEENYKALEKDFQNIFLKFHNFKNETEQALAEETVKLMDENNYLTDLYNSIMLECKDLQKKLNEKHEEVFVIREKLVSAEENINEIKKENTLKQTEISNLKKDYDIFLTEINNTMQEEQQQNCFGNNENLGNNNNEDTIRDEKIKSEIAKLKLKPLRQMNEKEIRVYVNSLEKEFSKARQHENALVKEKSNYEETIRDLKFKLEEQVKLTNKEAINNHAAFDSNLTDLYYKFPKLSSDINLQNALTIHNSSSNAIAFKNQVLSKFALDNRCDQYYSPNSHCHVVTGQKPGKNSQMFKNNLRKESSNSKKTFELTKENNKDLLIESSECKNNNNTTTNNNNNNDPRKFTFNSNEALNLSVNAAVHRRISMNVKPFIEKKTDFIRDLNLSHVGTELSRISLAKGNTLLHSGGKVLCSEKAVYNCNTYINNNNNINNNSSNNNNNNNNSSNNNNNSKEMYGNSNNHDYHSSNYLNDKAESDSPSFHYYNHYGQQSYISSSVNEKLKDDELNLGNHDFNHRLSSLDINLNEHSPSKNHFNRENSVIPEANDDETNMSKESIEKVLKKQSKKEVLIQNSNKPKRIGTKRTYTLVLSNDLNELSNAVFDKNNDCRREKKEEKLCSSERKLKSEANFNLNNNNKKDSTNNIDFFTGNNNNNNNQSLILCNIIKDCIYEPEKSQEKNLTELNGIYSNQYLRSYTDKVPFKPKSLVSKDIEKLILFERILDEADRQINPESTGNTINTWNPGDPENIDNIEKEKAKRIPGMQMQEEENNKINFHLKEEILLHDDVNNKQIKSDKLIQRNYKPSQGSNNPTNSEGKNSGEKEVLLCPPSENNQERINIIPNRIVSSKEHFINNNLLIEEKLQNDDDQNHNNNNNTDNLNLSKLNESVIERGSVMEYNVNSTFILKDEENASDEAEPMFLENNLFKEPMNNNNNNNGVIKIEKISNVAIINEGKAAVTKRVFNYNHQLSNENNFEITNNTTNINSIKPQLKLDSKSNQIDVHGGLSNSKTNTYAAITNNQLSSEKKYSEDSKKLLNTKHKHSNNKNKSPLDKKTDPSLISQNSKYNINLKDLIQRRQQNQKKESEIYGGNNFTQHNTAFMKNPRLMANESKANNSVNFLSVIEPPNNSNNNNSIFQKINLNTCQSPLNLFSKNTNNHPPGYQNTSLNGFNNNSNSIDELKINFENNPQQHNKNISELNCAFEAEFQARQSHNFKADDNSQQFNSYSHINNNNNTKAFGNTIDQSNNKQMKIEVLTSDINLKNNTTSNNNDNEYQKKLLNSADSKSKPNSKFNPVSAAKKEVKGEEGKSLPNFKEAIRQNALSSNNLSRKRICKSFNKTIYSIKNFSKYNINIEILKSTQIKGRIKSKNSYKNISNFSNSDYIKMINANANSNPSKALRVPLHLKDSSMAKYISNPILQDFKNVMSKEKQFQTYDFLHLRSNLLIQAILEANNEKQVSYEMYSQEVFVIEEEKNKSRKVLLITGESIYILKAKQNEYIVKHKYQIDCLEKITISIKNNFLLAMHFFEGNDLLIEIDKRNDLIYYFRGIDRVNIGKLKFQHTENFKIRKNGKYLTIVVAEQKNYLDSTLPKVLRVGNLLVYSRGILCLKTLIEKLVVLTSDGLYILDDKNKKQTHHMNLHCAEIHRIDSQRNLNDNSNDIKNDYAFEIMSLEKDSITFCSKNEEEMNEWINDLKNSIILQ